MSLFSSTPYLCLILRLLCVFIRWTVSEIYKCFGDFQEIDGQAFLLLTLPTVQEHMELKLGPAIKLCHQIERVKITFYEQFAH